MPGLLAVPNGHGPAGLTGIAGAARRAVAGQPIPLDHDSQSSTRSPGTLPKSFLRAVGVEDQHHSSPELTWSRYSRPNRTISSKSGSAANMPNVSPTLPRGRIGRCSPRNSATYRSRSCTRFSNCSSVMIITLPTRAGNGQRQDAALLGHSTKSQVVLRFSVRQRIDVLIRVCQFVLTSN